MGAGCEHCGVDLDALRKDWRSYERFIAALHVGADRVTVEHNVTLVDKDGSRRQIDCLVTVSVGPHTFKVIVECKAGNSPVERADIDELLMTREKVNAASAIVFACGEYQAGAVNTASKNGIKLYQVKQAAAADWWPPAPLRALVQVWSVQLENRISLPWDQVAIGTPEGVEWPKGISAPSVTFYPTRSSTRVVGRSQDLEQMIEEAARGRVTEELGPRIGVIEGGRDCVAHFSTRCDVKFRPPITLQERQEPPTFLQVPEVAVVAAVRVDQRSLVWKARDELDEALFVHELTEQRRFQVSRAAPDSPWVWAEPRELPAGADLGSHRRLVVATRETFRPEAFSNPWTTFGRINTYEPSSVPASTTLASVLGVLAEPAQRSV